MKAEQLMAALLGADYSGLKAHALVHVFEHPIRPLSNRWDTEHGGGCYLTVSPSSVALAKGGTRSGFVLTLHT